MVKSATFVFSVIFFVLTGITTLTVSDGERPNIILILAADLDCYGWEIETPNRDILAEWDPQGFDVNFGPQNILYKGEPLKNMSGPDTYHSTGSGWTNLSNTSWRLYKHYIHEGGIRTPLIAHWPKGVRRRGEFEKNVGHIIDFMPTFLELSVGKYPQQLNDRPILPVEARCLTLDALQEHLLTCA